MTARTRALAWLAGGLYFAANLLLAAPLDAPRPITAAAAFGLGASLALSAACWHAAQRQRTEPGATSGADTGG